MNHEQMNQNTFFNELWASYTQHTPQALTIERLFLERGEVVVNDHVAFRTFDQSPIDLDSLCRVLSQIGYHPFAHYDFPDKHLNAIALRADDPLAPKIFASELRRAELPHKQQQIIEQLLAQCHITDLSLRDLYRGLAWPTPSHADYLSLAAESEYAGWLATIGLTANHFTVSVNHLKGLSALQEVNRFLLYRDFALNQVGGLIIGGSEVYLAQSSTLADRRPYLFACGTEAEVPTCFYEFALRYPLPSGILFEGFVAGNANQIFDSTHR